MVDNTNRNWFIFSIIIAGFFGFLIFIQFRNLTWAFYMFIAGLIGCILYLFSIRCPRCGNLGALHTTGTRLLNSEQFDSHFTRYEPVGHSSRRNRDGEEYDIVIHHGYVNYTTTTTTYDYEDTITCKYCRYITKRQYQKQQSETYRA
jgi:hypothetical protein